MKTLVLLGLALEADGENVALPSFTVPSRLFHLKRTEYEETLGPLLASTARVSAPSQQSSTRAQPEWKRHTLPCAVCVVSV